MRTKPVPIHWSQLVRAAVVLSAPIAVGYLVDHIGYGALVSAGALPSITADVVDAYRSRAKRLSGALGAAVFGFALGVLTGADAVLSALVVIGIAAVSALISDAGSNPSIAGLQLFVFTVLGTGQSTAGVPAGISLACFRRGRRVGTVRRVGGLDHPGHGPGTQCRGPGVPRTRDDAVGRGRR